MALPAVSPGRLSRPAFAHELLEGTDPSIEQVARRAGLGSAASLRAHLQATLGRSPSLYRRAFRPASDRPGLG